MFQASAPHPEVSPPLLPLRPDLGVLETREMPWQALKAMGHQVVMDSDRLPIKQAASHPTAVPRTRQALARWAEAGAQFSPFRLSQDQLEECY